MTETIHKTLWKLFKAIKIDRQESGAEIALSSDQKRLLIGWKCNDNYHYIQLSNLKSRYALILPVNDDELYKLIAELIITPTGRQRIADILSCDSASVLECFNRVLKLKAFW